MDKIAQAVRRAEVNGFVAGLIDTGVIKVASEEEAIVIADVIEEHLPEEYDMEDAMAVAADVVDALDENAAADEGGEELVDEDGMVIEASDEFGEINEAAVMAAYGELSMAKEAGEISAAEFEKEAAPIRNMLKSISNASLRDVGLKAKGVGKAYLDAMKGKGIGDMSRGVRHAKGRLKELQKGVDATNKKYKVKTTLRDTGEGTTNLAKLKQFKTGLRNRVGATGAAYVGTVGAAGLGGKALYNKYNQ